MSKDLSARYIYIYIKKIKSKKSLKKTCGKYQDLFKED